MAAAYACVLLACQIFVSRSAQLLLAETTTRGGKNRGSRAKLHVDRDPKDEEEKPDWQIEHEELMAHRAVCATSVANFNSGLVAAQSAAGKAIKVECGSEETQLCATRHFVSKVKNLTAKVREAPRAFIETMPLCVPSNCTDWDDISYIGGIMAEQEEQEIFGNKTYLAEHQEEFPGDVVSWRLALLELVINCSEVGGNTTEVIYMIDENGEILRALDREIRTWKRIVITMFICIAIGLALALYLKSIGRLGPTMFA